jgi:hypothetical protein
MATYPTSESATVAAATIREAARLLLVYASLSSAAREPLLTDRLIDRASFLSAEAGRVSAARPLA